MTSKSIFSFPFLFLIYCNCNANINNFSTSVTENHLTFTTTIKREEEKWNHTTHLSLTRNFTPSKLSTQRHMRRHSFTNRQKNFTIKKNVKSRKKFSSPSGIHSRTQISKNRTLFPSKISKNPPQSAEGYSKSLINDYFLRSSVNNTFNEKILLSEAFAEEVKAVLRKSKPFLFSSYYNTFYYHQLTLVSI